MDNVEREALRLVEAAGRVHTEWVRYIRSTTFRTWDPDTDIHNYLERHEDIAAACRDLLNQAGVSSNSRASARMRVWENALRGGEFPDYPAITVTIHTVLEKYYETKEANLDQER